MPFRDVPRKCDHNAHLKCIMNAIMGNVLAYWISCGYHKCKCHIDKRKITVYRWLLHFASIIARYFIRKANAINLRLITDITQKLQNLHIIHSLNYSVHSSPFLPPSRFINLNRTANNPWDFSKSNFPRVPNLKVRNAVCVSHTRRIRKINIGGKYR